jgi:molybdopterin converting factor small subunit
MAKLTVNGLLRDAITTGGHPAPGGKTIELPANSVRVLIRMLEERYPGSGIRLEQAAVAIDGDLYSDALTEPLDEFSEVVFIPSIDGG